MIVFICFVFIYFVCGNAHMNKTSQEARQKNNHDQTHSFARDWRLSASLGLTSDAACIYLNGCRPCLGPSQHYRIEGFVTCLHLSYRETLVSQETDVSFSSRGIRKTIPYSVWCMGCKNKVRTPIEDQVVQENVWRNRANDENCNKSYNSWAISHIKVRKS